MTYFYETAGKLKNLQCIQLIWFYNIKNGRFAARRFEAKHMGCVILTTNLMTPKIKSLILIQNKVEFWKTISIKMAKFLELMDMWLMVTVDVPY